MKELLDDRLLKKYDIYADDYTDYPHKSNWLEKFGDKEYKDALRNTFTEEDSSSLLYVHIPFCKKQCSFCICYKEITSDYSKISDYLYNSLSKEMDLLGRFFHENSLNPNIKEIFLGGGSPTLLRKKEFDSLVKKLGNYCDINNLKRFCIEVDPRTTSPKKLKHYTEKGVNTISIGIQDFNSAVQKSINRIQPISLIEKLLDSKARDNLSSINFDFLVGLPLQTPDSIQKTMEDTISLSPDRISFCYFHYAPKFREHMKKIGSILPSFAERKRIFAKGVETIINGGYIRTGFEHFAKPTDVVANSINEKKATYTSLGAITGVTSNVIATGRSGHGIFGENYLFQNYYEKELYNDALSKGELPIYRGLKLSKDDSLRRNIIRKLRTYFKIDIKNIEKQTNSSFIKYFDKELETLSEFEKDGLISLSNKSLIITEKGKHFTDNIISCFDNYLKGPKFNKI